MDRRPRSRQRGLPAARQGQGGQWVSFAARQQGHTSPAPAASTAKNSPSHRACLAPTARMLFFREGPPCSWCFVFSTGSHGSHRSHRSQLTQQRGSIVVGQLGLPKAPPYLLQVSIFHRASPTPRPPALSHLLQLGTIHLTCSPYPGTLCSGHSRKPWHVQECEHGSQGPTQAPEELSRWNVA